MSAFFRGYLKLLNRYPYSIQIIQTGALMATGDVIAQCVVEKTENYDFRRTKQYGFLGMVMVGPAVTTWYKFLDTKIVGKCTNRNMKIIGLQKMLSDQILFAPIFLFTLLICVGRLKCKPWEKNLEETKIQYRDVLYNNYKIWPIVQLLNFSVVPLNFQVLFVQIVAVFWNTYISWRTSFESECGGVPRSRPPKRDKNADIKDKLDEAKEKIVSSAEEIVEELKEGLDKPKEALDKPLDKAEEPAEDEMAESGKIVIESGDDTIEITIRESPEENDIVEISPDNTVEPENQEEGRRLVKKR